MTEWISVNQEYPTAYERVLVSSDEGTLTACYTGAYTGWIDDNDYLVKDVRYWTPLPKAPNE